MTTINNFEDYIQICNKLLDNINDKYTIREKYTDIYLLFKNQSFFFNKNINDYTTVVNFFKIGHTGIQTFNDYNLREIIESKKIGLYIYNGSNKYIEGNTYLIINTNSIFINICINDAESDVNKCVANTQLNLLFSEITQINFIWSLFAQIFLEKTIENCYSKYNRILNKVRPFESVKITENKEKLETKKKLIEHDISLVDKIPYDINLLNKKINLLNQYKTSDIAGVYLILRREKKKIPKDIGKQIEEIEKSKKSKKKLAELAELKGQLKTLNQMLLVEKILENKDSNTKISHLIQNYMEQICNLKKGGDKSELEKKLSEINIQLMDLTIKLTELKKKESETIREIIIPSDPNWFIFEKYLFDEDTYVNYIFGLNCCLIFNLLMCVCANIHINNDSYLLFLLNKINNIQIPSYLDTTQTIKSIKDILSYITTQFKYSCLQNLIPDFKICFEKKSLISYTNEKLAILDNVQKLWFFLNYKSNTLFSQINSKLNITEPNTYNNFPLEVTNEIKSYMSENKIRRLLKEIKDINLSEKKDLDAFFSIITNSFDLIITENYVNVYTWIIVSFIIKFPLIIYNYEINNELLFKLCNLYGKWFKICSLTDKIHIYKYAYYLLINKNIQKFDIQLPDNKNLLLCEFYNDINSFPITDNDYYHDIKIIKNYILDSDIKIWYNENQDLQILNNYLWILTNKKLNIVFKNILLYQHDNFNIDKIEHINKLINSDIISENVYIDIIKKQKKIEKSINHDQIYSDDHIESYMSDSLDISNEYTNICCKKQNYTKMLINLLFPNLITFDNDNIKITSLLSLIQIIHSCKDLNTLNFNYPTIIPQLFSKQNEKITLYEKIIDNEIYIEILLPELIPKSIVPTELTNTQYNMTSCVNSYNTYLNVFVSFIQSKNFEYMKSNSDILPFIKYGYDITNIDTDKPIIYEDNLLKFQNTSIYTKNILFDNLLLNGQIIKECDLIFNNIHESDFPAEKIKNKIVFEKMEYNIFIFIYLFLTNDKNVEMITESNLFTAENIKISETNNLHKIIYISNCIKYYSTNSTKLYEYCNLLNEIISKEKYSKQNKYTIDSSSQEQIINNIFYILKPVINNVVNISDDYNEDNEDEDEDNEDEEIYDNIFDDNYDIVSTYIYKLNYLKNIIINSKSDFSVNIMDIHNLLEDEICVLIEKDSSIKKLIDDFRNLNILKKYKTNEYWTDEKVNNTIKYNMVKFDIGYKQIKKKTLNQPERNFEMFLMEHISSFLVRKNKFDYLGLIDTFIYNEEIKDYTSISIQPFESLKYLEFSKANNVYIKGDKLFNYYSVEKEDINNFKNLLDKHFLDADSNQIIYKKVGNTVTTQFGKTHFVYTKDEIENISKKNQFITVNYNTHHNLINEQMITYNEIKNIIINGELYNNKMTFLNNYYTAHIINKSTIKLNSPYFVVNNYINNYFNWTVENKKFIGNPKYKYPQYSLSINLEETKFIIKKIINGKETDEEFVTIDNALLLTTKQEDINFFQKIINITKTDANFIDFDSIFLWKTSNLITSIDLLNINTLFTFREESWFINDTYKIVTNNTLINNQKIIYKPEIIRWIKSINYFLLVQDIYNDIYIYICPFINKEQDSVCEKYMHSKFESNIELITEKLTEYYENNMYYIIKLSSTTFFPVITNKNTLEILFLNYLLMNNFSNIFDLWNPIRKYNIDYLKYCSFLNFEDRDFKLYFNTKIPSISLEKIIKNKFQISNYKRKYTIIKDIDKYLKSFEFRYYFSPNIIYPSITEYWIYALFDEEILGEYKLSDITFNIFYKNILDNYKNKNENNIYTELIEKYSNLEDFTINPLEFYYQYLLGFFATNEQNSLVDNIIKDITQKIIVEPEKILKGGYMSFAKYFINNLRYEDNQSNGHIHSLIMGGGKTKMITPLVIIKYLQEISFNQEAGKNHIYLVLPDYLVAQSFEYLSQIFNLYYPIKVDILKESRKNIEGYSKYSDYVSKYNENELQIYIMSDLTMKSGFLNNYESIVTHSKSHAYIFDEADTIIEPLMSELNYPTSQKVHLEKLSTYYNLIYDILYSIFKDNSHFLLKIKKYINCYELTPHFNLINLDKNLHIIINDFVFEKIIEYYDNFLEIKNIFTEMKRKTGNEKTLLEKYIETVEGKEQIPLLYTLFNFINEVLPVVLNKINRKDYGLINKEIPDAEKKIENLIIVPFTYADTPKIGSLFSNPLLTMCLTIIDYIVQIEPLNNFVMSNLVQIIINKYHSMSGELRKKSEILKEYLQIKLSINISDLKRLSNLTQDDIQKLRESNYFIKIICQTACELITFNLTQSNIAGIDLFMDMNIHNKSGFTGTPNISKFYDLNKENEVIVNEVNTETQKLIDDSIIKSSFVKMDYNDSQITYLEKIIASFFTDTAIDNEYYCNTLIDVGAICVGIDVDKIYDIVKKNNSRLKQFIYWNKEDVPYCIDNSGKKFAWNKIIGNNNEMFYYYDNKHTTGIDAVIPMKSLGLVLLGKNSRYRDVVQGIYRMRKLNINNGHKICFVLNNKLYDYIRDLFKLNADDLTSNTLKNWFTIEETFFNNIQKNVMAIQNIRSLRRYFNVGDKTNIFNIDNGFKYPDLTQYGNLTVDLIMGIKTYTNIEILNKIEVILKDNTNEKSNISSFLCLTKDKLKIMNITNNDSTSISQIESQSQEQSQEQSQNLQLNIEENIIDDTFFDEDTILRYFETFDKYFIQSEYYKILFDGTIKAYVSNNLKIFTSGPYFILYKDNNYFMIPFIEGIKLLENLENIFDLKCAIFDTDNVIYHNNLDDILSIVSVGKVLFKKILDAIYLDENNYISITKNFNIEIREYITNISSKSDRFNEFKLILDVFLLLNDDEIKKLQTYNIITSDKKSIYKHSSGNLKLVLNFFTANGVIFNDINMLGGSKKIKNYKIINKKNIL